MLTKYHRHYHSAFNRTLISFLLVAFIMVMGTVGMHCIEGMSYLDAFYFMSMIATAQGPTITPVTCLGKIFSSVMAFLSVGIVVAALGFLFGPLLGVLWKIGANHLEKDESTRNPSLKSLAIHNEGRYNTLSIFKKFLFTDFYKYLRRDQYVFNSFR